MKNLIGLLLLMAIPAGETTGRLFVRIASGFEVIVDGTSIGMSTVAEGGKVVDLTPGPHNIVVRSADGREGAFDVVIEAGQMRDVALSELGLRKLSSSVEDETGSLRIACVPDDCVVAFRESTKEKRGVDDLAIDTVPSGQYALTVLHGTETLRADVEVQKGMLTRLEANFTTGAIRVLETRRRTRRLSVAEANDALTKLAAPAYWKAAIRSALPPGMFVASASLVVDGVKVTMRVPSEDEAVALIRTVTKATGFRSISIPAAPRRDANVWVVGFTFHITQGR